jgi:HEAT repeat protein
LRAELALAGFRPAHLGELRTRPYRDALPILVRWLPRVRDGQTKWALVSALAVPWARPLAAPALLEEFRQTPDDACGLKWAIGYALTVVADDSVFDDIVALLRDRRHGRARAVVVGALGTMRRPEARAVLLELLEDPDLDVVAEALGVLGALKAAGTQPQITPFLTHPYGAVRGAAQRALATINQAVHVALSVADRQRAKA